MLARESEYDGVMGVDEMDPCVCPDDARGSDPSCTFHSPPKPAPAPPVQPIAPQLPTDPMEPVKTKVRPKAVESLLEDLFPGAMQHRKERIGGVVYSVKIWRYEVEVSVNLEAMTEVEKSGDATFTFAELPKDKRSLGKKPPVIIEQFTTEDLAELREGMEDARGYVMGIVQAITKACSPKPKAPPVDILDGD